jgi:hypothetical protein
LALARALAKPSDLDKPNCGFVVTISAKPRPDTAPPAFAATCASVQADFAMFLRKPDDFNWCAAARAVMIDP